MLTAIIFYYNSVTFHRLCNLAVPQRGVLTNQIVTESFKMAAASIYGLLQRHHHCSGSVTVCEQLVRGLLKTVHSDHVVLVQVVTYLLRRNVKKPREVFLQHCGRR